MPLAIGQQLGPYQIVAALGAGGMGEVYRALDTRLHRDVALKLIPHRSDPGSAAVDRFRREAHAASALNHPNIITIYEIGDAPEGRFIAMELVDGVTLREYVSTPSIDAVLRLGSQIARALAAAHDAGIVHRDIKPENIMVRRDGYVKVLDFGLARFAQQPAVSDVTTAHTEATTLLGTVRYMSPEQARGDPTGRPADVFALGVVLYELATAQHPFHAASPLGVLHAIAAQVPVAPAVLSPDVPDRLNDLIVRMLDRDERRRPTAADVAAELADLERTGPSHLALTATDRTRRRVIVGRTRERAELLNGLHIATTDHGVMLAVAGEAGLGKTTLVEDFLSEVATGQQRCRIARGRCSERLFDTEAYLPFLEVVDQLIHMERGGSVARHVKMLAPTWYAQLQPITSDGESEARGLSAAKAASHERFKRELAVLLQEISREAPTIVFLDDVHWADAATVDLLNYLATRFDSTPLLIVVTYRPSDLLLAQHPFATLRLELQARGQCRDIALPFLERSDIDAYLGREFCGHQFPPEFAALVYRRTEGSPLFMVDLLRELRERGVVAERDGHWTVPASIGAIEQEMPASIKSLIQRAIDRLDEDHRHLLTAASVQGNDFQAAVLARALTRDPVDVEDRLDALERAHGLIQCSGEEELPDGTVTLAYRFVHVLYQNALYGSLRPARRASLSGAVANALVSYYGAKSGAIAAELAVLYEAARDLSPAVDYLLLATQNAVHVFAGDQAIALARRGLRLLESLPDSPDRARRELGLRILLGAALTTQKGYSDPELEATHARTRALCLQVDDARQTFAALYGVYTFSTVRANFAVAIEIGRQMQDIAVTQRDSTLQLIAQVSYAAPLVHIGDFRGARQLSEQSLTLYDAAAYAAYPQLEIYGADPRTTVSVWLGFSNWFCGWPDRSVEKMREGVALAKQTRQPFTLTYALTFNAWLHGYRRDVAATLQYADEALAVAQEHGFGQFIAVAALYRYWAIAQMGRAHEAIPAMQYALAAYRGAGGAIAVPTFLALIAEAFRGAGNHEDAIRSVTEAREFAQSTGERCWEAELHRLNGELLLDVPGHEDEAVRAFQRAAEVARELGARVFELRALTSLVALREPRAGGDDRARLAQAFGWFTEGFDTADLQAAQRVLATSTVESRP